MNQFPGENDLGNDTKTILETILISGTYISFLPELTSAQEYPSLLYFIEDNNFILSCESVVSWYLVLNDVVFNTGCVLPDKTSLTWLSSQTDFDNAEPTSTHTNFVSDTVTGTFQWDSINSTFQWDSINSTFQWEDNIESYNSYLILAILLPLIICLFLIFVVLALYFVRMRKPKIVRNTISTIYRDPNHFSFEAYEMHNAQSSC